MSRKDYLAAQRTDDPRYDDDRAIARAHLALAEALARRREALGRSPEELAEHSGVAAARLEAIEEGDTTSLPEVLRLCASLGLVLIIGDGFRVRTEAGAADGVTVGASERGRAPALR